MSTHLTPDEQILANTTQIDVATLQLLKDKVNAPLHHWKFRTIQGANGALPRVSVPLRVGEPYPEPDYTHSFMIRTIETDGVYFYVDESEAIPKLLSVRSQLAEYNASAMILAHSHLPHRLERFGIEAQRIEGKAIIGVLNTPNWRDFLWLMGTNGINFGLETKDIIARFEAWSQLCRFEVVGAGCDWCELFFHTLPDDVRAFAEDTLNFCPEGIEEESFDEAIQETMEHLPRSVHTWFWWD